MSAPIELRFTVDGCPVPKARPRFDPRSGRTYSDAKSEAYQGRVRSEARAAAARMRDAEGRLVRRVPAWPVDTDCAREAWRASGVKAPDCECAWCSQDYELECYFVLPDRRTRDRDNLEGNILDGCTGALWRNDRIAYVRTKTFALNPERPRVEVIVRAVGPIQLELAGGAS